MIDFIKGFGEINCAKICSIAHNRDHDSNCLVFEKIAFLCTHFGDRRTDKQLDSPTHKAAFAVASRGLKSKYIGLECSRRVIELLKLIDSVSSDIDVNDYTRRSSGIVLF